MADKNVPEKSWHFQFISNVVTRSKFPQRTNKVQRLSQMTFVSSLEFKSLEWEQLMGCSEMRFAFTTGSTEITVTFGNVFLLSNPISWVQCTLRPNNLKCCSLEQRKVYCKENRQLILKRLDLSNHFTGRIFKGKIWKKKKNGGKGCRLCVIFFWLAGDKVTGWCLGNLSLLVPISLESICLWWAYSHHSPPGWGVLASVEELRVRHQIVICVPSRATSHPVILLSC